MLAANLVQATVDVEMPTGTLINSPVTVNAPITVHCTNVQMAAPSSFMQVRITAAVRRWIVQRAQHCAVADIAQQLGRSRSTIAKVLKEELPHRPELASARRKQIGFRVWNSMLTAAQRADAVEAVRSGRETVGDVARRLGVARSSIYYHVRNATHEEAPV